MSLVLINGRIVDGINEPYIGYVEMTGDTITNVAKGDYHGQKQTFDLGGCYLMPGMIDVHIHGSYGYDFIKDPQTSVDEVAKGLYKEGTTAFLASLTVISHKELCSLLEEYADVISKPGQSRFLGVHSEGPFLAKEYKALMDDHYLRPFKRSEFAEMISKAKGKLKTMTIAPELPNFDDILDLANENQVKLMIGHSAATCDEAISAIEKGCSGYTHLYNAMSQHTHRDPGIVTAALLTGDGYAELICDGFHIDRKVIKVTYDKLGSDKIVLITDAMLGKGMGDGEYVFSKLNCRKVGNTVRVIDTGRIAGSAITQLDAIKNMREFTGCSISDLAKMSSLNPARLLGIDHRYGSIGVHKAADLIVLDEDLSLKYTFIDGECVYSSIKNI